MKFFFFASLELLCSCSIWSYSVYCFKVFCFISLVSYTGLMVLHWIISFLEFYFAHIKSCFASWGLQLQNILFIKHIVACYRHSGNEAVDYLREKNEKDNQFREEELALKKTQLEQEEARLTQHEATNWFVWGTAEATKSGAKYADGYAPAATATNRFNDGLYGANAFQETISA